LYQVTEIIGHVSTDFGDLRSWEQEVKTTITANLEEIKRDFMKNLGYVPTEKDDTYARMNNAFDNFDQIKCIFAGLEPAQIAQTIISELQNEVMRKLDGIHHHLAGLRGLDLCMGIGKLKIFLIKSSHFK
jgi:hypothetical protein